MRPSTVFALVVSLSAAFLARADLNALAAEVKVLSAGAMKEAVLELAHEFEHSTGHKLVTDFETVGTLRGRIEGGEAFDVAILTGPAIDALSKQGKIADASRTDLGRVAIGVAVRSGAAKPDIGSTEAFKRTVLAAKSLVYADPAKGASSGIHFAGVLQRLGIAEEVKPKATLLPGGYVVELVAKGEAELGVHQISEILPVAGVELVGPLPADLQQITVYSAGQGAAARDPDAARALLKFLSAPGARPVLKSKGVDPS